MENSRKKEKEKKNTLEHEEKKLKGNIETSIVVFLIFAYERLKCYTNSCNPLKILIRNIPS